MTKLSATEEYLQGMAAQILEKAKERGLESNFLFTTTFDRYWVQLDMLGRLRKKIESLDDSNGACDDKTAVRLVRLYNSVVAGANGTASTLMSIIKKLGSEMEKGNNKLLDFLNSFHEEE